MHCKALSVVSHIRKALYSVFLKKGNRSSKVNYFKDTKFIISYCALDKEKLISFNLTPCLHHHCHGSPS